VERNVDAISAFGEQGTLSVLNHINQDFAIIGVNHLCSDRHFNLDIFSSRPRAVTTHPVNAGAGFEMLLIAVINQRIERARGDNPNITALAAIAAIRPAKGDIFLTPKRDASASAISGFDEDFCLIEKFHDGLLFGLSPNGHFL